MKFNKKFLSIFFIALLAVVLVACGGTTTAAPTTAAPTTAAPTTVAPTTQAPTTVAPTTQAPTTVPPTTAAPTTTEAPVDWVTIEAALRAHYSETLDNDEFVATADLTLITTISDATIAWSSSNTTYLGHDGTVTQPAFATGDQTVILTATLTIGAQDHDVMFFVTIDALAKTDAERAAEALAAVMVFPFKEKWSSADSDSLDFLTTAQDADGASYEVVWTSSHPEYIAVDGTIVQPEGEDVVVTMTATITINEVEFSQTKTFTVSKMEEGTPVSTIAEAVAMGEDSYVKILGVTVIAKYASGDVFFTDGVDILYIYTPTFTSEVGGVYDITGVVDYYYNAPQLTGNDTHPLRAEASAEAVKAAPISVKASILDLISEQTMPTPENLFQYKAYTVTAKIYVNAAWGNYSVFLVPSNYDFEAPLADGATQPNGDSIMIYYKSDMSVLAAFHGQEVTIDIITQGWRSDKSVWYANFFGTAADVEINIADDAEAVATALAALTYPTTITADTTLDFPASLYGVTLTYASDNPAINDETGFVDAASQTEQQTVTLTVTANRGEVTDTKVFTIKVGELQVSTIAQALAGVKNDQFKVNATIIGGGYSTYYIQDATGAIGLYVPSALRDFFGANTGQLIEVVGTRDTYNGLNQLSVTTATLIEAGTLPAAVNVNGEADLLPYQSQLIELVAVEVTAKSTDSYGNISLTLKDLSNDVLIAARWDSRYVIPAGLNTTLTALVVGDIINIQAILGWYNAPQIAISAQTVITMTTDAEKLALDVADIPLTVLTTSDAVETTPLLGTYGSTIVWDLATLVAAGGTYDNVTGQVVMPSIEVQTDYAVTATLTLGSEEAVVVNVTVTVVPMTAAEKLAAAHDGLGVDEDCDGYEVVLLPLTGLYGTTIAWTVVSGDAVLAVDGTTLTFGNAGVAFEVVLQATITLGEETPVTKDFTVTVTPAPIITDLSLIPAMADGTLVYVQGVVTGISFDGAFIQDANGVGFFLYKPASKAELAIGDEVVYKGTIGSYSNAKQLATGGVLLEELSAGNALIYNTVTADEIHAFAMADAGSLFTFDGFVYKGVSGTTMTLGYTLADGETTGTVTVRYYTNWADLVLVANNYALNDTIPAVNFILYNFRDGLKQLDVLNIPTLAPAIEALDDSVEAAITYEYVPVYEYHFETSVKTGNNIHNEYLQSALLAANPTDMYEGVMFDLARYLGALYRATGSTIVAIQYDGAEYFWNETIGLLGSNWVDDTDTTLVSVLVADFQAEVLTDSVVLGLVDSEGFVYVLELTFNITMDLDEAIEATIENAILFEYVAPDAYTYYYETSVYADMTLTTVYLLENVSGDSHEIMWDMARFLGALYRVQDSNVASIVYKGQEYTWNELLGLHGSNWAYNDGVEDITLVSVIVADFQAALITDTVTLTLKDANGYGIDIDLTFSVEGEVVEPTITELFISEYGEGSSNNKWIEIYNGTGSAVDLSIYSLALYSNGSPTAGTTVALSGTLASGDVYVVYNAGANATVIAAGDLSSTVTYFNGDDAVALLKNGTAIDVFGVIGTDPGSAWTWEGGTTVDRTLVRKSTVTGPTTTWNSAEWDVYPTDTFTYVGSHTIA